MFLSDGSATDAANPTISVSMPSLTASNIGLGAFATATLATTANFTAGTDSVTIGAQVYNFVAAPAAAGDVMVGNTIQQSLDNLMAAVNGGPGAGLTYVANTTGVGSASATGANPSAQITEVVGDSAIIQSLAAGTGAAASGAVNTAAYVPASGDSVALGSTNAASGFSSGASVGVTDLAGGSGAAVDLTSAANAQSALTAIDGRDRQGGRAPEARSGRASIR